MAKPDRIYASELLEREVMDLRAGEIVGAVTDFNVTREGVVTQLGVLPLQWYRGGKGIAPGAITNVTRERVSIEDSSLLSEFDPDGEENLSTGLGGNLYGKPVLQADGELLGTLADFAFDLASGQITDIVVYGDEDKRSKIGVESIQTIGKSYIVVNRSGAETTPGPKPAASAGSATPAAAAKKPAVAPQSDPHPAEKAARKAPPSRAKPKAEHKAVPPRKAPSEPASIPVAEVTAPASAPPAEIQLDFGPETEASALPIAAETLEGLGLSTFDRRKAEYLFGRNAHRDIRTGSGDLILKAGLPFNRGRIAALMEAGLLNAVFLEMTQHKG